jgi:hypothetical protein
MSEQPQPPTGPTPQQQDAQPEIEERTGLNPAGADAGMGEPNTFEPEEG